MTDIIFGISNIEDLLIKVSSGIISRSSIENLEDSIRKIFSVNKKSSILDINFPLLWEAPENRIFNRTISLENFPSSVFPLDINKYNGFVIKGRILQYITDFIHIDDYYHIYFYDYATHAKFMDILGGAGKDSFQIIEKTDVMFVIKLKKTDIEYNIKVYHKKIFGSVTEVLLDSNNYIHRFCFDCKKLKFIGTAMFYLELDYLSRINDPVIINVNQFIKKYNDQHEIHKLVMSADFEGVFALSCNGKLCRDIEILNSDGYTALEQAILLYVGCNDTTIRNNLKNIIDLFVKQNYIFHRQPGLFAYFCYWSEIRDLDFKSYLGSIFDLVLTAKDKYNVAIDFDVEYASNNFVIDHSSLIVLVNTFMLKKLLYNGNQDHIMDYLTFINYNNFDINIFSGLNDYPKMENSRMLVSKIIDCFKKIKNRGNFLIEIILKTEMINFLDCGVENTEDVTPNNNQGNNNDHNTKVKFDVDILFIKNIVLDLVKAHKYISLLYLFRKGYDIFNLKYDQPLLHYIINQNNDHDNDNDNYTNHFQNTPIISHNQIQKMISFCSKFQKNCIDLEDSDGNTFVHKLAYFNPKVILSLSLNSNKKNHKGETFLHILVKNNEIDVVRNVLSEGKYDSGLLNQLNNKKESILLLAAKLNYEDMFILLRQYNINDLLADSLGNTVYHYIVINKMLIGSLVIETDNVFGFKPSNYTCLKKYWKFKDMVI